MNTKKRFVYGAIAFIWIVIPTFVTAVIAVTTDIVEGRCVIYGVYQSAAVRKTIAFFTNLISYFLPLALMVFCYGRIVHALRSKVFLADLTDACSQISYWHATVCLNKAVVGGPAGPAMGGPLFCRACKLQPAMRAIYSKIVTVVRILLVIPAINAASERFSTPHRVKTYLRSAVTQTRMNSHNVFACRPIMERTDARISI